MSSIVIGQSARFTLLSPTLIRMEFSPGGSFEDRRSIRALTRPEGISFPLVDENVSPVRIESGKMIVEYTPDGMPFHAGNLRALDTAGKVFWNPSTVDHENLGGVHVSMDYVKPGMMPFGVHPATIEHHHVGNDQNLWAFKGCLHSEESVTVGDGANLSGFYDEILATEDFDSLPAALQELMRERWKYPPAILSRSGFFLYNDTPTARMNPETEWVTDPTSEDGYMDLYLFFYACDFKQALSDYRLLFGPTPIMPRYGLGLWYSRYPTFSEEEIYQLVDAFEEHDLPLDVFVLDLEWHKRGWHGFDWDTDHIPNPDKLLGFLRNKKLHTTFNVHPNAVHSEDNNFDRFLIEAGIECDKTKLDSETHAGTFSGFDASVPRQAKAFMDVFHKPVQDQGMDFWWIDGNCPVREIKGLERQLWTNHVYYSHMKENYPDRRPMIFSREPGLGAHRYPFHFTGDAWSYFLTLENQVEQTLRAGHMGQSYTTHDIGGHMSTALHIDPELYMRWVQFAVLSPVIRLHSSKQYEGVGGERRPWLYGRQVMESFHAAIRLRMELVPYLYTLVRESHTTGLPICRSNCIEAPEWEAGYAQWDAYFLGDRIYAAPVVTPGTMRKLILPPGVWIHGITGKRITSDGIAERTEVSPFAKVPLHYIRGGSLLIKQPYSHRASALSKTLLLELYASGSESRDTFTLYEDDGMSQDCEGGAFTEQVFTTVEHERGLTLTIAPRTGSFTGAPALRTYEIRLMGAKCTSVTLNGKVVNADDEGGLILIDCDPHEEQVIHLINGNG
ncbi:MAG: DUF5110 domain-containing protein [Planctomycetes bacterium]|nr:DUF5110 domain-containing protein [Planctomycetota bacterium]